MARFWGRTVHHGGLDLTDLDIGALVDDLARLAAAGGEIALEMRTTSGVNVSLKADSSPVTAADLAVDAHIVAHLCREYPQIPVVTEERAATHIRKFAKCRFFLVDPIDGTKEFIADRGEFTINIALIEDGSPIAGAVGAPAVGRLFAGARGVGAYEVAKSTGVRKTLTLRKPDNEALIAVASRSHITARTQRFLDSNKIARTTNAGSSLKFCMLASGEADIYPRFGPTMEWDTAAGHAILLAAGGLVEEISGRPLKYGKPDFRNGDFIAYTPGTTFRIGQS
jgi:3'(2'), 5'-bisphosphate nucleotidase